MKSKKRIIFIAVVSGILSFGLIGGLLAQEKFPSRPIQFIIPWAPGGGGTINAQTLQAGFEKAIGGNVQIVNKPGGGGRSPGITLPILLPTVTRSEFLTPASSLPGTPPGLR
jgi:tripartite-type tricarboxylate transporter receptor subunit TctC